MPRRRVRNATSSLARHTPARRNDGVTVSRIDDQKAATPPAARSARRDIAEGIGMDWYTTSIYRWSIDDGDVWSSCAYDRGRSRCCCFMASAGAINDQR